jgi:hypothetical protein
MDDASISSYAALELEDSNDEWLGLLHRAS